MLNGEIMKRNVCPTGITGLDEILLGGLPCFSLYSVQGEPGSGKTTFAMQFLVEGIKFGGKSLYITFSETEAELQRVAESHGLDISQVVVMDLSSLEEQLNPEATNTLFHPSEIELNQVFALILKRIEEVNPDRIVFDSVSEMRLLAETPLRYRRQILALKQALASRKTTVLFLDDLTVAHQDLQIHSIAHGVVHLSRMDHDFGGERRRLRVIKLRGVNFTGGFHDMEIRTGGIVVHPRMISSQHEKADFSGVLKSGSEELDALLGGGLDKGTANLFIGPAGTGKSSMIMKYVVSATNDKEKVAYFCFDETLGNLKKRSERLGIDVTKMENSGLLRLQKIDPAEISPGALAGLIQSLVKNEGYKVIVIDSLNGYIQAMPQENFLILQLHELLAFLNDQGVVTLFSLAQQGMIGSMSSPIDLTYLADTVILSRYFESDGAVKKAISVIKKRTGSHENTIREYTFGPKGIVVGEVLREFEGVLSGIPKYYGKKASPQRNSISSKKKVRTKKKAR